MSQTSISLVTGAAKGIGQAIALHLLKDGRQVVLLDKDASTLDSWVTVLPQSLQQNAHCFSVDLTDEAAIKQQIRQIESQLGPIEHLAHAAGILKLHSLVDMSRDQFQSLLDVHVLGSFHLVQAVCQAMRPRKKGAVVIIGSNAGNTPRNNMGGYCTSKAALHMLAKCFALELAPLGIRCNIVSPGSTRTHMQTQMWNETYQEAQTIEGDAQQFRLGIPLNKIAEPQDIAQAVAFLLSDHAGHITMHDLRVDGGATLDQ